MADNVTTPPADAVGVWYRSKAGRPWDLIGYAGTEPEARTLMFDLMGRHAGDWCTARIDAPPRSSGPRRVPRNPTR